MAKKNFIEEPGAEEEQDFEEVVENIVKSEEPKKPVRIIDIFGNYNQETKKVESQTKLIKSEEKNGKKHITYQVI